jgi:hypothetical protein
MLPAAAAAAAHLVMVVVRLGHQVPVLVRLHVKLLPVPLLLPVYCVHIFLAAGEDGPLCGLYCCAMRLMSCRSKQSTASTAAAGAYNTCSCSEPLLADACFG